MLNAITIKNHNFSLLRSFFSTLVPERKKVTRQGIPVDCKTNRYLIVNYCLIILHA